MSSGAHLPRPPVPRDHLIRPPQQRLWNRQPEGPCGLKVDHQLKLGRLLNRKIIGFGALQDVVDVGSRAPKQVREAEAIGRETTRIDVPANVIHHRELVLCCQFINLLPLRAPSTSMECEQTGGNEKAAALAHFLTRPLRENRVPLRQHYSPAVVRSSTPAYKSNMYSWNLAL
jgi:hypothetical protein